MSLRTTPGMVRTLAPLEPSPGNGPDVSFGIVEVFAAEVSAFVVVVVRLAALTVAFVVLLVVLVDFLVVLVAAPAALTTAPPASPPTPMTPSVRSSLRRVMDDSSSGWWSGSVTRCVVSFIVSPLLKRLGGCCSSMSDREQHARPTRRRVVSLKSFVRMHGGVRSDLSLGSCGR